MFFDSKKSRWLMLALLASVAAHAQYIATFTAAPVVAGKRLSASGIFVNDGNGKGFVRMRIQAATGGASSLVELMLTDNWRTEIFYTTTFRYQPSGQVFVCQQAHVVGEKQGATSKDWSGMFVWTQWDAVSRRFELLAGDLPFETNTDEMKNGGMVEKARPAARRQTGINVVTKVLQQTRSRISKASLAAFFTANELPGKEMLSPADLMGVHEKSAPTIHLLTVHADEKFCDDDMDKILEQYKGMAEMLNVKFNHQRLKGSAFHIDSLKSQVAAMRVKPNDVIVFAYSGHGFSYDDAPDDPFPQLALWNIDRPKVDFIRTYSMNLEEVYQLIRKKGARVNIVSGDCCNSFIGVKRRTIIPTKPGVFGPPTIEWDVHALSNLLLRSKYSLIMAATKKGEEAASHAWYGGFFTFYLMQNMNRVLIKSAEAKTLWTAILTRTNTDALQKAAEYDCSKGPCSQHVNYQFD